jgi:hypothetical protein
MDLDQALLRGAAEQQPPRARRPEETEFGADRPPDGATERPWSNYLGLCKSYVAEASAG